MQHEHEEDAWAPADGWERTIYTVVFNVLAGVGFGLLIAAGMALSALGLGLFAAAPAGGAFLAHVLPGMLLLGLGCGMALNPVMLAGLSDVAPSESGLVTVAKAAFGPA